MRTSLCARVPCASSLIVPIGQVHALDASLVSEISEARRRLEQLAPEVIALMAEVAALEDRVVTAAEHLGVDALGMATRWSEVAAATGADELAQVATRITSSYTA
jgi:hypothetical protein